MKCGNTHVRRPVGSRHTGQEAGRVCIAPLPEAAGREIPDPRVGIGERRQQRRTQPRIVNGPRRMCRGRAVPRRFLLDGRRQTRHRLRMIEDRELLDRGAPHIFVWIGERLQDDGDARLETEIAGDPDRALAHVRAWIAESLAHSRLDDVRADGIHRGDRRLPHRGLIVIEEREQALHCARVAERRERGRRRGDELRVGRRQRLHQDRHGTGIADTPQ